MVDDWAWALWYIGNPCNSRHTRCIQNHTYNLDRGKSISRQLNSKWSLDCTWAHYYKLWNNIRWMVVIGSSNQGTFVRIFCSIWKDYLPARGDFAWRDYFKIPTFLSSGFAVCIIIWDLINPTQNSLVAMVSFFRVKMWISWTISVHQRTAKSLFTLEISPYFQKILVRAPENRI